jgi:hypothetical protein
MKTTMTNAAIREAHNDRVVLKHIWDNRAIGDNEWVRTCALDAFCEALEEEPVENRRHTFLRAVDFLLELIDLDTEINDRFGEQSDAGDAGEPEREAAIAAIKRLDIVYNSLLDNGYFDAGPLEVEQLGQQIGDYCCLCDCRCAACAGRHAAKTRAFLWPAMRDEHQLRCKRSTTSAASTLDAGEEVGDIIAGAVI